MKEQLNQLKAAMYELDAQKSAYAEAKDAFDKRMFITTENIKAIQEQIDKLKEEIRPLALAEFTETSNKKLIGGIGIQERSYIEYDDAKALEFAKDKDMFLQLDKKAFDKAAPAMNLDFVKIGKNVVVTFPAEIKLEV